MIMNKGETMRTIKFKAELKSQNGVDVEVLTFDNDGVEDYEEEILVDAVMDVLDVDTSAPYEKVITVEIQIKDVEYDDKE